MCVVVQSAGTLLALLLPSEKKKPRFSLETILSLPCSVMGLTAAFSRCLPRKPSLAAAPAPLALPEPPAAEPPKKERKISKTKFDLPQDPPSQNLRPWFKYALALASLALLWRRIDLGLSSQTTDAVFVFIAIELLVLIRRKATASTTSDERRTSLPGTRGKGSSMSLANEMEARVIAQVRQKLRQAPTPEGLDEDDELLDVQVRSLLSSSCTPAGPVNAAPHWQPATATPARPAASRLPAPRRFRLHTSRLLLPIALAPLRVRRSCCASYASTA